MRISVWSSYVCSSDLQGARLVGVGDHRGGGFGLRLQPFGVDRRRRDDLADEALDGRGDQLRQLLARLVLQRLGAGEESEQLVALGDEGGFGNALTFGEAEREGILERTEEHTSELQSLMRNT